MARILSIDYGRKRVGIAVTDPLQIIANGLTTIHSKDVLSFLEKYISREPVEEIVVGYAKQMNNTDSESMQYIKPFVAKLRKKFTIPVRFFDERFTSKMAFQSMLDAGLRKKKRQNKALVDEISATIILQSYLEAKHNALDR